MVIMSANIQRFISIILIGLSCFISGAIGLMAEPESPDVGPIIVSDSATYDPEQNYLQPLEMLMFILMVALICT